MTAIVGFFSRTVSATNEDSGSAFPVVVFSVVGLLISICIVLAFGAPPLVELEIF